MKNSFSINKIEYIVDSTIENDFFVGFKIIENKIHVCFPIGFELKDSNDSYYKKVLKYLYKTVSITKRSKFDYQYSKDHENEKIIPMNSYIYVLSDFFSCGMYQYNEKKYRNDSKGKVNWKKTYKNNFYVQDNSPIYLNTIVQYNRKETDIITALQLFCVCKAIDILVFFGDYNKPFSELTEQDIDRNIHYYNNVLDYEIRNTNSDKKKLLLINIKNIINDCYSLDNCTRSFGTKCYEYSFEKMINKLFGNVNDISKYYPKAIWKIDDREGIASSNLREDTIFLDEKNKNAFVIDSKYYKYGIYNDDNLLPNTKNIYKQIVYGDYVKEKIKKDSNEIYDVYNIFIIPTNSQEFIKYKGVATMEYLEGDDKQKKVHLLLVNMNDVIDNFFNAKCSQTEKMIAILEKSIQKFENN